MAHPTCTQVYRLVGRWAAVTIGVLLVSPLFIWSLPLTDAGKAAAGILLVTSFGGSRHA